MSPSSDCPCCRAGWTFLYKLFNAVAKLPGTAGLLKTAPIRRLRERAYLRHVAGMPDRRHLETVILPALREVGAKRVLFVGCAPYTQHVPATLAAWDIECWTTDILPENAPWGNPAHHIVCDIAEIDRHVPAGHIDAIVFTGVMGYGVSGADMATVSPALAAILRPGGHLLIGWNRGLVEDPCTLASVTARFRHGGMPDQPDRYPVPRSTHVFDWFTPAATP